MIFIQAFHQLIFRNNFIRNSQFKISRGWKFPGGPVLRLWTSTAGGLGVIRELRSTAIPKMDNQQRPTV